MNAAGLENLRRSLNSLSMGLAQSEVAGPRPGAALHAALRMLSLGRDEPRTEPWMRHLQAWNQALQPQPEPADTLARCGEIFTQALASTESEAIFDDDWAAQEEATLLAALEAMEQEPAAEQAVQAVPSEEPEPVVEAPAQDFTAETPADFEPAPAPAFEPPEQKAAAPVQEAETLTAPSPRVGRRGLSLVRKDAGEAVETPQEAAATPEPGIEAAPDVTETPAADVPVSAKPILEDKQQSGHFFAALPWHHAKALPEAARMAEHVRVEPRSDGAVDTVEAQHNPVLAATAQALAWADAAAREMDEGETGGGVREAVFKQNSAEFFGRVPWRGQSS